MEIVIALKNEKFSYTRSFLRPRGAVFVDFHLKMGIFDQNQLHMENDLVRLNFSFLEAMTISILCPNTLSYSFNRKILTKKDKKFRATAR